MIYIIIAIPLFIMSLLSVLSNKAIKHSNIISLLFLIVLIFLASIRYRTGSDYLSYVSIWNDITPFYDGETGREYLEPGFRYFVSILKMFTSETSIFFFSMAFLTLAVLYSGLKKIEYLNIYVAISLYFMIFYMPYTFNAMRQAVAMSIFIYSLIYIINNDFKKVLFLSLLAASFHLTGLLILISYFISRVKIKLINYFLIGMIVSFLVYYLNILGMAIDLFFGAKFSAFSDSWGSTSIFQFLIRFIIVLFFVFISIKVIKTKFFEKTVIIYLLGFFIYIALADANMMAVRFNMFFRVLEVVLFSMVLYQSQYITNRVLFFIFTFALAISTFYLNISNEDNIYQTIF